MISPSCRAFFFERASNGWRRFYPAKATTCCILDRAYRQGESNRLDYRRSSEPASEALTVLAEALSRLIGRCLMQPDRCGSLSGIVDSEK